jgi:hypothetical protein
LIGFRNTDQSEPVIYIDETSPKISHDEGENIFLEFGGNSDYLKIINNILSEILNGYEISADFNNMLVKYGLIEPFIFRVELKNASKFEIASFFTISEEKLNKLDDQILGELHSKGFLESIYMILASLANFRSLIDKKNKRVI